MSQKPLLDTFSEETADESKILEKLFIKFYEETDCHAKTKILQPLIQAYLLYFKDELETNIKTPQFLELLSQIPLFCKKFLQIPNSTSLNETDQCVANLENKSENLESASLCFDALLVCLEALCVTNQCVTLIKISLTIICEGYSHCKESEIIYGDLLEQYADQLGIFYRKIESLQTVVLLQLDKLDSTKYSENDVHINFIVLEMGNLCQIVFNLDADIAFELWEKYLRLIHGRRSLKHISNINSISAFLASKNVEILQLIKFNSNKSSTEDEELSAKLFFYLDALSSIMKLVNGSTNENISQFITFLLSLLDCLVTCYSPFSDDKIGMNIIKSSLVKNTFPLLSYLYTDEEFLKSVLLTAPDEQFHMSGVLSKLCLLQFLESTPLQIKENILKSIFSDFLSNNVEDDMKILYTVVPCCTITKTKSESTTLYQFTYEQMTHLLKLLSDSSIIELENAVLNCLLSSSEIIYLLISDVWLYRLRCSSIDFLKDRCYAVLQYLHMKGINNINIENLVNRMLRFLPRSYKADISETFSSLKFLQESKNVQHRFGIPDHTSTENEIEIDSEEQIQEMLCKLNDGSCSDVLQLVMKACTSLELCALFVSVSGSSEILQFLEFASELFKTGVYEIQIAVLTFIKSLSLKRIPEHNEEFGKIVTYLAQLFSEAIHSKNYIVKYEARNIFSYFAKLTPHIKIVQETVKRDPSLKPALKSYMNTLPENNFLLEKEKSAYLKKQILDFKNVNFEIPPKAIESLQQIFSKCNFRFLT